MCDNVMDEIPTEPVQTLGSQPCQAVLDSLSNPVIVSKVLEYFSNRQLLKLSFVNKLWNYEARSVMRKRGNLTARLESDSTQPWHQVLEAFGTDLQKMNIAPYSAITIVISTRGHTVQFPTVDLTQEEVLARLALKRLSLSLDEGWWTYKDFPALLLVKKLLQYFSGILEDLTLDIRVNREEFIEHFIGNCSFAGLKVLKLKECGNSTSDELYTNYMKVLVSRAKNLQELHTNGPVNLVSNVLEGSEAVLVYGYRVLAPFENIPESAIDILRLQKLKMIYTGSAFNFERFNRIAPVLLQACCSQTLRFMCMDLVLAVPLMYYGISLKNVEHLSMEISYKQMYEPEILRIVKNFDFTRIFPEINRVKVTGYLDNFEYSSDHMDAIIEQADVVLGETMPDRAAYVKELCLHEAGNSDVALSFFAEMFPNVELLQIGTDYAVGIQFGSIWKHWVDLRGLEVTRGKILDGTGNLDSIFCGIFSEEVAELRLKDEDYLKRVNIVPVMPAITCLKNLKTLTLHYDTYISEPYVDDETFLFSKVTGLIAFARCPSLAIKFHFRCPDGFIPATRHLTAFASVTSRGLV